MNLFKTHLMADYDNNIVVQRLVKVFSMFFLIEAPCQRVLAPLHYASVTAMQMPSVQGFGKRKAYGFVSPSM